MRSNYFRHQLSALSLASLGLFAACDLVGGSNPPIEPLAKPEYERAFDEFSDVPNQITAQVQWAAEPIDDAVMLADEIAALRAKVDIDADTFASMCTVAFKDGTIEIGAVTQVEEVKAEIEATLARIKEVGAKLQTIPARSKTAGQQISKMVMSTPKLVLKTTKELSGELAVAVGDGGVKIEADIDTVKKLPKEIKTQAVAAKDVLAELPQKAQAATSNLMAAMAGKPYTPLETTKKPDGEAGGEGGATDEGDTAIASGGAATGGAATGAAATPPAGETRMSAGPAVDAPLALITARVRTLETRASEMGKYGDWMSAAAALEEAVRLMPDNQLLGYQAGNAAFEAKDCASAQRHFERFLSSAEPAAFSDQIQSATKALGELKAFDCPARTPADELMVAETLRREAAQLGTEGDWGGAALVYAQAYGIAPTDHQHAYDVGVAAWKARACSDALTYFYHFTEVAEPGPFRRQIRESNKYIERAELGECQVLASTEKEQLARELYGQAQTLELALDYMSASGKYERAYALLPTNHALAFRIAESSWAALRCEAAGNYYRIFVSNISESRYAEDINRAKGILARIDSNSCPDALWSAASGGGAGASGSSSDGDDGGAANEAPPESAKGGGGSVSCSIAEPEGGGPAGLLAFGLLALASLGRRRRGRASD